MRATRKRAPGRQFEVDVAQLLRGAGFRTDLNARAARPRQTDIYARAGDLHLLIEVKDRKRKIDVADVDNLRVRLHRTPADVVGVIFTNSKLTATAIREIESDRTRELLVFDREEISHIRQGTAYFRTVLDRKRDELRIRGRALLGVTPHSAFQGVRLPRSSMEFLIGDGRHPYVYSHTDFVHAALALEIPDPGWGNPGGEGALLTAPLTLSTHHDLRDILGCIHQTFGLSTNGAFTIHQSGGCWHGVGVERFIDAVRTWRDRYLNASLARVHHSEDVTYFDRLRDGWIALSTRQRVWASGRQGGPDCYFHDSELAIQLPGIPVDTGPFVELCRYIGNEWGQFQYVARRLTRTLRFKRPVRLRVVGTVVEKNDNQPARSGNDRVVVGVIAKNPFYRRRSLPKALETDSDVTLHDLLSMELLLCDLRDHHTDGDVVDWYVLQGLEVTQAHSTQIIRPFGTWNRILAHADREDRRSSDPARAPTVKKPGRPAPRPRQPRV